MMNNLYIYPIHKSASTLQNTIYNYINHRLGYEKIIFQRLTHKEFSTIKNLNNFFIVLRNPINTLISQYYSFGWTHSTKGFTAKKIIQRKEIQELTLEQYILKSQKSVHHKFKFTYNYMDKIIKYEDMMNKPERFLLLIAEHCNATHLINDLNKKFLKDFTFNSDDLSEKIVKNKVISHKRNLDHDEYKKKISKSILESLDVKTKEILSIYDSIPSLL